MTESNDGVSRRAFLRAAAGGAAAAGATGTATAAADATGPAQQTTTGGNGTTTGGNQTDGNQTGGNQTGGNQTGGNQSGGGGGAAKEFRLGGEVGGWVGQAPASIEGQTNPALPVSPGDQVTITWENLDGAIHDLVVNAGSEVVAETDDFSQQGATASVTFTAPEGLTEYVCTYHSSMVGEFSAGGGEGGFESVLPDTARTIGVATTGALVSVLGLAYVFMKYGGGYAEG